MALLNPPAQQTGRTVQLTNNYKRVVLPSGVKAPAVNPNDGTSGGGAIPTSGWIFPRGKK